jgi:cytochrome c-type biogenesis protein CcmH
VKVPAGPVHDVAAKLVCQCGCNLGLADCPHEECPSRPDLVARIQAHLSGGLSVDQAARAMASEYGDKILAAPPFQGLHVLAWVLPGAAALGGAVLVAALIRRWRRVETRPGGTTTARKPSPEAAARLEEELRRDP